MASAQTVLKEESVSPSASHPVDGTIESASPSVEAPTGGSWKRKRPPILEIPTVLGELPVEKGGVGEASDIGVLAGGPGWAVFSRRGRRKKEMEDVYKADPSKGFFGVFDGHGGNMAAVYASENLPGNVFRVMEKCEAIGKMEAIRAGFLKTDQEFLKQGVSSGSCCVMALIERGDIVVSSLGDSRAVLCRDRVAETLTVDHTAKNKDEKTRIEEKGGFVEYHCGAWRVQGILAVTRSIGDIHLKEWVSAEPDTILLPASKDMDFLILASDGLWDKVSNQEAVDAALSFRSARDECGNTQKQSNKEEFGCENTSPRSILGQRASKRQKGTKSHMNESCHFDFDSENISPHNISGKNASASQNSNNKQHPNHKNGKNSHFDSKNISPYHMSVTNASESQKGTKSPSPGHEINNQKQFDGQNAMPPLKVRKVACSERQQMKKNQCTRGVVHGRNILKPQIIWGGACEKLASIAAARGSTDDITVMIIDLKHFISS